MSSQETLEDKVKETSGLVGKVKNAVSNTFYSGLAAAATCGGYALAGINAPLTGIAFSVGSYIVKKFKKAKVKVKDLLKEYIVGNVLGVVGSNLYKAAEVIDNTTLAGKVIRGAAGVGIANPIFTAAYVPTDYMVKNGFNPTGLGEHFKKNFWPVLRDSTKWLWAPLGLTINGYAGGYPGIVAADTGYRIVAGYAQKN